VKPWRAVKAGGDAMSLLFAVEKHPHIDVYFVASFPYFNGTGPAHVCIFVNRRNNEALVARTFVCIQANHASL